MEVKKLMEKRMLAVVSLGKTPSKAPLALRLGSWAACEKGRRRVSYVAKGQL